MISDELKADFAGARFLLVPGHFSYIGGAERQVLILAASLLREVDCSVDVLGWGGEDGVFADALREIGVEPVVFPWEFEARGTRRMINAYRLSKFISKKLRPDYILPFVTYHCKVIGSIWRWTGARFTWWNQRDEGRGIHGTKTEHRLMETLPAIVSNSWEGRDFLIQKFSLADERVRVINNGIEIPESVGPADWRERLGVANDDILIAMTANLSAYKDHFTLLQAFSKLQKSEVGTHCRLVLAGRLGETTQKIKALAFDLGLCSELLLPGLVPMNEVGHLLAATDILVHSSVMEGCPNSALEAMAHGLCVLGTDISGMRQALGEDLAYQYLAPPGDSDRLAQLMQKMAADPLRRTEAGEKNRRRVRSEFSVQRMTQAVLETIQGHCIPPKDRS